MESITSRILEIYREKGTDIPDDIISSVQQLTNDKDALLSLAEQIYALDLPKYNLTNRIGNLLFDYFTIQQYGVCDCEMAARFNNLQALPEWIIVYHDKNFHPEQLGRYDKYEYLCCDEDESTLRSKTIQGLKNITDYGDAFVTHKKAINGSRYVYDIKYIYNLDPVDTYISDVWDDTDTDMYLKKYSIKQVLFKFEKTVLVADEYKLEK